MEKIALIIDKTPAYIDFHKNKLIKEWKSDGIKITKSLNENNSDSLFEERLMQIVQLDTADDVKQLVKDLEEIDTSELLEYEKNGLIIITSVARTSTKKLEAIFKKNNWSIFLSSKDDAPLPLKLLSNLNLSTNVKEAIVSYVGDDSDILLPIIEGLDSLPKNVQQKITLEEIFVRIPQPPGSIPPWEVEQAILAGNLNEAIDKSRRINYHSSFLLWIAVLKNKMINYYEISQLINNNPRITDNEITTLLNINPRGFYYTKKTVKKYSPQKFQQALELIIETEKNIKGESRVKSSSLCEILIVKLCSIFKEGE